MNKSASGEMPSIRWTKLPPDAPPSLPAIRFYGLLSPFLYIRGVGTTWSDSRKDSLLERYLRRLLLEDALNGVSAAQLARATGVPAQYWRLTLLTLERAGLLKMGAIVQDSPDDSEFALIESVANDEIDDIERRLSEILRRARVVRDVLLFPHTQDTLITSGGTGNALDQFIGGFADPRSDWFRTSLSVPTARLTLREYLAEMVATAPPIGADTDVTNIKFEASGPMPLLAPVKALAGFVHVDGDNASPHFTHFQPAHTNTPGNPAKAKGRALPRPFPLSRVGGLASVIRRRLNMCNSDDLLAMARQAAPSDRPEYGTLRTDGSHVWQIDSSEPAAHSLDIAFSDVRLRLAISTNSETR